MKKTLIISALIVLMPVCRLVAQEMHSQSNITNQPLQPNDTMVLGRDTKLDIRLPQTTSSLGVTNNYTILNNALADPVNNSLTPMPFNGEPNGLESQFLYQQNRAFARFYIYQSNWTQSYMAMREFLKYDIALKWQPNDRFAMMAGGTFMRQYDHFSPVWKDLYGVSSSAEYHLNNRTLLSLYGTYFFNAKDNLFANNLFFPTSTIGTSVLYQVNKKTRIGVGIDYRYDSNKNQWKPQSGSKVSVGF